MSFEVVPCQYALDDHINTVGIASLPLIRRPYICAPWKRSHDALLL
jgi:hypothetical protein